MRDVGNRVYADIGTMRGRVSPARPRRLSCRARYNVFMSINSKARRDARRKQQPKRTQDGAATPPMPAHAHLLDDDGRIMGGVALRGGEWALVLDGRVVTTTDSAAMAIAMLHRAAMARGTSGAAMQLRYSDTLRDAAAREAETGGQTLEQYLAALEAERVEHMEKKRQAPPPDAVH
jgi:hypothetical protein